MSDLMEIKAGKYVVIARFWDEITSKPGQPTDFIRHRKGSVVDLDVTEARRLVKAGAVKPKGKANEADAAAPAADPTAPAGDQETAKTATVAQVIEAVGDDAEKAKAALASETGEGGSNRSSLVKALEAVIAAAEDGNS